MIRALLVGTLHADPQQRTSASGKVFTTGKLRADASDGGQVWCSLIAFGEQAERLATLKAGAAISVAGRCKLSAWTGKDGQPNAGLDLVVDEITTLRGKPRSPQGEGQQRQTRTRPAPMGAGFDDDLPDCFS
jgi:single-stranded DNA-binding protein